MALINATTTLPRLNLSEWPTPLHEAPRLSAKAGCRILFKRDDLTAPGAGGNKIRKLEFLMADALQLGADCVVTGGGPDSNHAQLTAAVARRVGLEPYIVLWGSAPEEQHVHGNYMLDLLLGAEVSFTESQDRASVDRGIESICGELWQSGRRPYAIPRGGASALGCVGYVECARELAHQLDGLGLVRVDLVLATGSCGTQAGLWVGFAERPAVRVLGVTVSRPLAECESRVRGLGAETAALLKIACPTASPLVFDAYVGEGYGIPSAKAKAAIGLVAHTEGVFLDPIYTGKAMAGLLDLARQNTFRDADAVVFLHTGGFPGLFSHGQRVLA